ncbi:DNA topoisomerase III [Gallibacterium anatis]|uniref:DNA topoisomerase n=2 Tax=Gallibacterium anatis TaxID=750 RepID=U1H0B0_9PAST|nr:DNA topoisomerase III [Gallibacterium anatis]ERF77896.1 DNA topoisomerase III [Gallibacterium anatis 12656/12]HJF74153.1 DNA topoisomerase III [Gallibacterium anatis]
MKLFLCEKPSQGRDIAKFLGATQRGDGYLANQDKSLAVTWCIGHLVEQAEPHEYNEIYKKWSFDALPIIPTKWIMKVKKETAKQYKVVIGLIKKTQHIVIATDPDREGEVIARELLDMANYKGIIQRLWLSALDDGSIRKALSSLKSDTDTKSLYFAGLARSRADWLVGMNLTRLFTLIAQKQGYKGVMSVGRVQSPTLAIVVQRDREITHFKPKPFYQLKVELLNQQHQSFLAYWQAPETYCDDEGRCIDMAAINQVISSLNTIPNMVVSNVETKPKSESPPLAFDLGTLQQTCSRLFGMGAAQVLKIAQSLYETHKATTYPRTDCGYLPESMIAEIPMVIKSLVVSDPKIEKVISTLDLTLRSRIWNDSQITAHHGIIPTTQKVDLSKMDDNEFKVYQLIRQHYLAQFLPLYKEENTTITLHHSGNTFIAKGKKITQLGWKTLFSQDKSDEENHQLLPMLNKQDLCQIKDSQLLTLQTTAPKHYTEGTLIAAMKNAARFVKDERLKQRLRETEGLGTEATRADVIENLLKRGYLEKKKRNIVATPAGIALIDILPDIIKDPGMTALWEQALNDIANNKMNLNDFMQKQSQFIAHIIQNFGSLSLNLPPMKRK